MPPHDRHDLKAELAFTYLLFGNFSDDPCLGNRSGHCPPTVKPRLIDFTEPGASHQVFTFSQDYCVIAYKFTVFNTGEIFFGHYYMANIDQVNLGWPNKKRISIEFPFRFSGRNVTDGEGKTDEFDLYHEYYTGGGWAIDHDINAELVNIRNAVERYQQTYCRNIG